MALTDSLISYWTLDEASGSRADSHGSNTLTDNNTVTQAVGKLGNAGQFTAANNEYLSIADNADLSVGGDVSFEFACWVYLDSVPAVWNIFSKLSGASEEYSLDAGGASSNQLRWIVRLSDDSGRATLLHTTTLSTGTWYFINAYHDAAANQIGVAVDNAAAQTVTLVGGGRDGTSSFLIGAYDSPADRFFNGRIDSVGFWKRVLTSGERTLLYNGGAGLEYPFLTFQPRPGAVNFGGLAVA